MPLMNSCMDSDGASLIMGSFKDVLEEMLEQERRRAEENHRAIPDGFIFNCIQFTYYITIFIDYLFLMNATRTIMLAPRISKS